MQDIDVLLVDDEQDFVNTLAERMEMRGMHPRVVFEGESALDEAAKQAPDVMVLDLRMPGLDGIEVLRRIREAHPETQVIILTGHGSASDADEAERLGAFQYLKKPSEFALLMRVIQSAYQNKRSKGGLHIA